MSKLRYKKDPPVKNRATEHIITKLREDPEFMRRPAAWRKAFEEQAAFTKHDLNEEEIPQFEKWMKDNNNSYWDTASYDPMVAFKQQLQKDARGHTSDAGKKPAHPTFSTESVYHEPNYDNKGPYRTGGAWVNSPSNNSYFLPSAINMRFAHGRIKGKGGLRDRMNSQGDYDTKIVPIGDKKAEDAMLKDTTGMDWSKYKFGGILYKKK